MPKTGTSTLGIALALLNYKHQSHDMDLAYGLCEKGEIGPILDRAKSYESFEDWPWHLVYEQFDQAFPGTKFILTERLSVDVYLRSHSSHRERFGQMDPTSVSKPFWWDALMPDEYGTFSESSWREIYETHSQKVRAYFRNRPDDLLIVCWESGDGWEKLCSFLHKPIPHAPFPHANRADSSL